MRTADRGPGFALLHARVGRRRPDGRGGREARGRRDELRFLREAFQTLVAGDAQCIWITGPSGIGKTALVENFLDGLDVVDEGRPLLVRARCHEREAVPYKAFDRLADAASESWYQRFREELDRPDS